MAASLVHTLGSPALRKVAKAVSPELYGSTQLNNVVQNMILAMRATNGAGIAAPQIGEDYRVFVVHGTGKNPRYPYKPAIPLTVFVNPEIEILDDTPMHMIEGCLSVPGVRGRVQRASKVRCTARHLDGSRFILRAEGHVAGTLQHENDHLNATLFPDIAMPEGLMLADGFEKYYKEDFFKYAADINTKYPTPIVWEEGSPWSDTAFTAYMPGIALPTLNVPPAKSNFVVTSVAAEVSYEADLTWTGSSFERDVRVTVGADGRISNVDRRATASAASPKATQLPGRALIPGFVNAHSHAFQRGLRGKGENYPRGPDGDPPPSFWTWRGAMYGLVDELDTVASFKQKTLQCFQEMAAAGITTCGEFHYFRHVNSPSTAEEEDFSMDRAVVEAAREANIRLVLLSACYQRGGFDDRALEKGQRRFRTSSLPKYWQQMDALSSIMDSSRGEGLGVVVHSLRAVGVSAMQELAAEAYRRNLPLHVHLEEQPQEIADCIEKHGITPLALLLKSVPEKELVRLCAVHCTHSKPDELSQLIAAGGGVCVCPLTEASLGDGVFLALNSTGGRVSIGTDCNARIDMLEEMRWLEYSQRLHRGRRGVFPSVGDDAQGLLAKQLLDCATVVGAKHLGVDTGIIEVGKWADFALLDLQAPALAATSDEFILGAAILGGSGEGLVVNSCVAGAWTKPSF